MNDNKIIKSVTIEINGQELTLPVEVARKLFEELKDLFEKKSAPKITND